MNDDDRGTALIDFMATSAPGSYTMTFWGGVDGQQQNGEVSFSIPVSVMSPSAPGTVLADGFEFGTLAGWTSWRGLDGRTVAYYPLDGETSDHSFYGNHGTAVGDPVATTDRWGQPGGALLFDGIVDQILVDNAPSLDLVEAMTLAAWIRPTVGGVPVVGKLDLSFGEFLYTADTFGSTARGKFRDSLGDTVFAIGYSAIALEQWQLLVVTYDGEHLVTYLDGVVQGHGLHPDAPIGTGDGRIEIGSLDETRFGGSMDDVLIMNRALTFREVSKLMQ